MRLSKVGHQLACVEMTPPQPPNSKFQTSPSLQLVCILDEGDISSLDETRLTQPGLLTWNLAFTDSFNCPLVHLVNMAKHHYRSHLNEATSPQEKVEGFMATNVGMRSSFKFRQCEVDSAHDQEASSDLSKRQHSTLSRSLLEPRVLSEEHGQHQLVHLPDFAELAVTLVVRPSKGKHTSEHVKSMQLPSCKAYIPR